MPTEKGKYPSFPENMTEVINIPPSKYQNAVNCYRSVEQWVQHGDYPGLAGHLPPRFLPVISGSLNGTIFLPVTRM